VFLGGAKEICTWFWLGDPKEGDRLEDLGVWEDNININRQEM